MKGMPKSARRKGPRRESVDTAWDLVSLCSASTWFPVISYILRLAIEAHKRAFSRVQVLRCGYGGREQGEWTS